jgi:hypothetical protein
MPTIKVPDIKIPEVDIPETPFIAEHVLTGIIPGCNLYHRDLEITNNPSILYNDRKAYITCPEGEMPSFNPIEYDPQKIIKTVVPRQSPQQPEYKPVITPPKEEKKPIEIPPCPGKKDLRIGSFVNEKRLERVSGYKRGEDGIECITLYEDVPFKDQYIPNPPQLVSTALIASVAATTPLLLNLVKPLVKNIIKKLTKKKKDVE